MRRGRFHTLVNMAEVHRGEQAGALIRTVSTMKSLPSRQDNKIGKEDDDESAPDGHGGMEEEMHRREQTGY